MNELSVLATTYRDGGPVMHFILAAAVFVIAIAIERMIVILPAAALNSRKLIDDLVASVTRGDLQSARNASRMSSAPAARVAQAMLAAAGQGEGRVHAAADDAATLALAPLQRRLPHLNLLANVATLLGLLGTITGLITAFAGVGAADPSQRSAFLAAGISTALNATAFGLLVAVPTLLVQGWLVGQVESVGEQVEEMMIRLTQALARAEHAHAPAQVLAIQGQRAVAPAPARAAAPAVAPRNPAASQGGAQ